MCWQVSKTAPTGEYLGTGSFMIRGTAMYTRDTGAFGTELNLNVFAVQIKQG